MKKKEMLVADIRETNLDVPIVNSSEELVVTGPTEIGAASDLFAADAGAGNDYAPSDVAIPFLAILQKGSPQVDPDNQKYIDGAKPGMVLNTLTGEVYPAKEKPIKCISCGYKKIFTEWTPRDEGGGFLGHHDADSDVVRNSMIGEDGRRRTTKGTWLVDTAYYFLNFSADEGSTWHEAMVSMTSTQLKKSRKWNSIMSGLRMTATKNGKSFTFNPPSFSHVYNFKTVPESNDKGNWYGWEISVAGPVTDGELYARAKELHSKFATGQVQAGPPPSDADETAATGDKIPF